MFIEAVSEIATQVSWPREPSRPRASATCARGADRCRAVRQRRLGWVKYGVIAIIIGAGFASSGALIVGKFGQMGRAAQLGASGLFWTVIGAIAFVMIYAILNGIVGNGC